jgi:hypothetical protein
MDALRAARDVIILWDANVRDGGYYQQEELKIEESNLVVVTYSSISSFADSR